MPPASAVGAIVGGGILALADTAFAATGPGAVLAFLLNGLIALTTALSFTELATAFPQSGGTYLFAKRVVSVGAAFNVGWVVWFASIVAAALYALGFAAFALDGCGALWSEPPAWLGSPTTYAAVALGSTLFCTAFLVRTEGTGGNWINVLKVLVFGLLIVGGLWAWQRDRPEALVQLKPFLPHGAKGLFRAMGYTFIALQGFDLVAAAAGKIKRPRRNIPLAMLLSLGIALAVYLPLLLLICIAGVPKGMTLETLAMASAETMVTRAAGVFVGPIGFWIVLLVGLLSMFSALVANLFAASHIAAAMAQDRTLPHLLARRHPRFATPHLALWCTGGLACVVILLVGDIGPAGATASLIFLVTFALANLLCIMIRVRKPDHTGVRTPRWPVVPGIGMVTCVGLAIFQGAAVPAAGVIAGAWLVMGFFCFVWLFGPRARVYDASREAADPDLLELRGRSPLVLVPIANPANAETMALLGTCVTPPRVGRVLLLNITLLNSEDQQSLQFETTTEILRVSMTAALRGRFRVESLATVAQDPWTEIDRVARSHRCATVLLGMNSLADDSVRQRLENLANRLPGNVMILRAPAGWRPRSVTKALVPIGGKVVHNALRARLLNGLQRRVEGKLTIQYLLVMPPDTKERERARAERLWSQLVTDETRVPSEVQVALSDDVPGAIIRASGNADLLVLGLNHSQTNRRVFGSTITRVACEAKTALIVIGQRG